MLVMRPLACRVSILRSVSCTIFLVLLSVPFSHGIQWDSAGAALAFQEASLKRTELSKAVEPSASLYLDCAKAFRKVHRKDPHYAHTGTAIYEEGLLYQEMGDRFRNLEYYRKAAKRFELLVKDYNGNRYCPDALLRLGDIYEKHLKDETAAQNAYQTLRAQYKSSNAAHHLPGKEEVRKPASIPLSKPAESPSNIRKSTTSVVQNIRYWSTNEYTRITIDVDSNVEFVKERLSNPERLYFDITNARLERDLGPRTIPVGDEILKQIRIASKNAEQVRIVLDLSQKIDYSIAELGSPFRIVVDLHKPRTANVASGTPKTKPASSPNNKAAEAKSLEKRPQEPPLSIRENRDASIRPAKPVQTSSPAPIAGVQPAKVGQKPVESAVQSNIPKAVIAGPALEAKVKLPSAAKIQKQPSFGARSTDHSDKQAADIGPSVKAKSDASSLQVSNQSTPSTSGSKNLPSKTGSAAKSNEPKNSPAGDTLGLTKIAKGQETAGKADLTEARVPLPPRSKIPTSGQPPRAVTAIVPSLEDSSKPTESGVQPNVSKEATADPIINAKVMLPPLPGAASQSRARIAKPVLDNSSSGEIAKKPDVGKEDMGLAISRSPKPAPPTSRGDRTLTRVLGLKIRRIVLDPGHGGHDLGSVGPEGLLEKDLVLSLAIDLKRLLEDKLGADVILTRYDDIFISLEERTAIANQYQADLFISIHANSSRARSTSGVETYYLDFAKTKAEREIAARENATAATNIHELENLIKKIAQADKAAESRELALMVQKFLYSGAKKAIPSTQDRGVRSAPFIVLIGAKMPSVLAEVAFLSNPRVEKLLKKTANQDRLVKALYSGIEGYAKTLGSEFVQNRIHIK